jgi:hypothetical protein
MFRCLRFYLIATLSLALLLGGVHRAPDLDPAKYLVGPDGLSLILCGPGSEDERHDHGTSCDACLLSVAALPERPNCPTRQGFPSLTGFWDQTGTLQERARHQAHRARAPPFVL